MSKGNDYRYTQARYRTQYNAALAPDILPKEQPKRRPQAKPRLVPQQEKQQGLNARKCFRLIALFVLLTAAACCLVMRNAQIYENNRSITRMNKEIQTVEMELNYYKNQLSADSDLKVYMEIGLDKLAMDYPTAEQIVRLEITPAAIEAPEKELSPQQAQVEGNWFDSVLNWVDSLKRRD